MKKLLYTIGILMFLSAPLHPWLGLAADTASTPEDEQACSVGDNPACRLMSRLEYALREKENQGLDWGDSFGATTPEDVGQNLYLMVYQKSQTSPMSEAIKSTASQYGLPPERMSLILGGDISPILERSPMMRIDDAVNIYNSMISTYNDKKNTQDVQATINARIEPAEMFANGDLEDSGFDLINDLNNIEIILFQKKEPVSFGGQYSAPEDDSAPGTAEQPSTTPAGGAVAPVPVDTSGVADSSTAGSGVSDKSGTGNAFSNPFSSTTEDKSPLLAGGINPNQCFTNQNLDQALDKFSQDSATNPKLKSLFVKKSVSPATAGTAGENTKSTPDSGADVNISVPSTSAAVGSTAPAITAAPPDDFSSPALCDEIVCISLDFVQKAATATFQKTDNCIQCHVQYINEALQKTISHSLIPAKATGNLGESALCKNAAADALRSVGMNVSINVVPMVTPSKDDMIKMGNITDEWDKYAQVNGGWNYSEIKRRQLEAQKSGKPVDSSPVTSDSQRMLEIVINNAPDGATQAQIMEATSQALSAQKAVEAQDMLVVEIAKNAFAEVTTMKALEDEMKAMNSYFESFQKQIRTLIEEDVPGLVSSQACKKLDEKQACT